MICISTTFLSLTSCILQEQATTQENVKSNKTCLMIIDVQKGFVNENTKDIPSKVEKLQHKYDYVIVTKFYNLPNSFFRKLIKWNKFGAGSLDAELAFKPKKEAMIIKKYLYTSVNKGLLNFLKSKNIKTVYLCGLDTDICVTKNAVDLIENGIIPIVLTDYCGSNAGKAAHLNAIKTLKLYIGKDQVITGTSM